MRPALFFASVLMAVLAAGCPRSGSSQGAGIPERQPLPVDDVSGLSGIAVAPDGALWLVAERDRVILRRAPDGTITRSTLEGVAPDYDVESVAFLSDGSLALGVERNRGDGQDAGSVALILLAEIGDGVVRVTARVELDTGLWGLSLQDNEGIEGLCRAGGHLVAGIETVGAGDGVRYAPVGVYDLERRSWKAYRLRLSSTDGSLSAIACRMRDGLVEIIGVERYFGVLRILRARLPAQPGELVPEVLLSLDSFADSTKLNIEGVAVGDNGDLTLVVDNHYREISGPNELVFVQGVVR